MQQWNVIFAFTHPYKHYDGRRLRPWGSRRLVLLTNTLSCNTVNTANCQWDMGPSHVNEICKLAEQPITTVATTDQDRQFL